MIEDFKYFNSLLKNKLTRLIKRDIYSSLNEVILYSLIIHLEILLLKDKPISLKFFDSTNIYIIYNPTKLKEWLLF